MITENTNQDCTVLFNDNAGEARVAFDDCLVVINDSMPRSHQVSVYDSHGTINGEHHASFTCCVDAVTMQLVASISFCKEEPTVKYVMTALRAYCLYLKYRPVDWRRLP